MNLSPHFTLAELTASQTAVRLGIDNTAPPHVVGNLARLAGALERVRAALGSPVHINSGYRSPQLNAHIGGSKTSAHMDGRAADFVCPGFGSPRAVCQELILAGVPFDKLIYEGTWVHYQIPREAEGWRRMILTAKFNHGSVTYLKGIV